MKVVLGRLRITISTVGAVAISIASLASSEELPQHGTVFASAIVLAGPCGAAPKTGSNCSIPAEPAADVELRILPLDGTGKDLDVRTNEKGTFQVELLAGSYEIRLAKPVSPWVLEPFHFSLRAGDRTHLIIPLHQLRG